MNLRATPYKIDFVGNRPTFTVRTSPFHTEGRRYARSFAVRLIVSGSFNLYTPHGNYQWDVSTSDRPDSVFAMKQATTASAVMEQLQAKLINNHDINLFYAVTAELRQNDVLLTFTAREYGAQGNIALQNNSTPYTFEETVFGLNRSVKDNYKIAAWFQCGEERTPTMFYDDNDGDVTIGTEMLKPYLGLPDIPSYGENAGAKPCPHAAIRARLLFAESENGKVGVVKQSDEITLIRGRIEQYCADNNIPDWESNTADKFHLSTGLSIFGQNNGDTVKTDTHTEQYLYVANFTNGDIEDVPVTLATRAADGENTSTAATVSFPAMSICRVPVGAAALGIAAKNGLIGYSISLGTTGIVRNFHIVPRPYNARTFLLENHVGLYESFVFDHIEVERATTGDRILTNRSDRYVIDESTLTITARTGQRNKRQMKPLAEALDKENNLLLDGQYAWRISLIPGTFTVIDESADLIEVEMKFSIVEKVNREPLYINSIEPGTVISRKDNIINQTPSAR